MSGGSYDYLYCHTEDLSGRRGTVEEMAERLEGLPYAAVAAAATRRVLTLLADAQVLADQLAAVWHDVEWWDSSDSTETEVVTSTQIFAISAPVPELVGRRLAIHADLPAPSERRRLRKSAGLSQAELAHIVGVTTAAVGHWETGTRSTPRGQLLDRYVEALRKFRTLDAAATTGAVTDA